MASEQHPAPPNDDVEGKIFVGGLSWQTTEESMRSHFEKFGVLRDIALMIDKRTCQPRYKSADKLRLQLSECCQM
jgi:RNA recognition motif-containing protein